MCSYDTSSSNNQQEEVLECPHVEERLNSPDTQKQQFAVIFSHYKL